MEKTTCSAHENVRLIKKGYSTSDHYSHPSEKASQESKHQKKKDVNKKSSEFQRGRLPSIERKILAARSVPKAL